MVRCVHCGGPCDEVVVVRRFLARSLERLPVCDAHAVTVANNLRRYGGEVFGFAGAVF